jgi:hypothetical protein
LQKQLNNYENLTSDEKNEVRAKYDEYRKQSNNLFTFGFKNALETEGDVVSHSRAAQLWQAFINESYIGKFFTQEIVTTPIQSLLDVIKWMTAFLATEYMKRWIAENVNPSELYSQVLVSLVVFIVICDAYLAMIRSYIRTYQSDLIQGKDYDA